MIRGDERLSGNLGVLHIVGIAGIGMSGLAEILDGLGYEVQGSDLSENDNTQRLKEKGIKLFKGHHADNIKGARYVIISTAVPASNPEVKAALENAIPVVTRAELLAELVRDKDTIAISGSHGKTTTTTLVASMLESAGENPTVINGGIINNRNTNAYLGDSNYLVVEADESDATFIKIPSKIVAITNIDREHMNFYKDFDDLVASYREFITNTPFYGFAVLCADHPEVRKLASTITNREIILYGIDSQDANIRAHNIRFNNQTALFDVAVNLPRHDYIDNIQDISLHTMGKHNVLNSLAALAIGARLGLKNNALKNAFSNFAGVKRRFTKVGEYNGALIIDDYAHHPAEVQATLETARRVADQKNGRVLAIFQPHRFTRVKDLFGDFQHCFNHADVLYISDIYAAGEQPIDGISKDTMVESIRKLYPEFMVNSLHHHADLPGLIASYAKEGDVVIFMGAGNITHWAYDFAKQEN